MHRQWDSTRHTKVPAEPITQSSLKWRGGFTWRFTGRFPVKGRRLVFGEHTGKLLTELLNESGLLGLWGMAIAFGVIVQMVTHENFLGV